MESPLNRFNWIARFYDPLTRIVFGKHIVNAQILYLETIAQSSKVLILGGGSGWILKYLHEVQPSITLYYVEASSEMISMARKNAIRFNSSVHFIHGTENSIPKDVQFDVIITNFYFDLFTNQELSKVISKVSKSIQPETRWFVTEFQESKRIYHQILLMAMYWFFKVTCGLNTTRLPDWEKSLSQLGFEEKLSQDFFNGFIKTSVFGKSIG